MSMDSWIKEHRKSPEVQQWIEDHPPPEGWIGSPMAWAYTEMPDPDKIAYGLGALAGLALVWWIWKRG